MIMLFFLVRHTCFCRAYSFPSIYGRFLSKNFCTCGFFEFFFITKLSKKYKNFDRKSTIYRCSDQSILDIQDMDEESPKYTTFCIWYFAPLPHLFYKGFSGFTRWFWWRKKEIQKNKKINGKQSYIYFDEKFRIGIRELLFRQQKSRKYPRSILERSAQNRKEANALFSGTDAGDTTAKTQCEKEFWWCC